MSVLAPGDLLWSSTNGFVFVCAVDAFKCYASVLQYRSDRVYPPSALHGLGCHLQDWERGGWELVGEAWACTDTHE